MKFDSIDTIEAGFAWDSNMKIFIPPFSIGSIAYELTFPAPYIENGKWEEIKDPLKQVKRMEFREIGNQKCFIVNHPETLTFEQCYKDKGVKNVRYYASFPEHSLEVLETFIKLGLSSENHVLVENKKDFVEVLPLDVLTQVLRRVRCPKEYKETEVLWVSISGEKDKKKIKTEMECLVSSLPGWETAGSNIDTGITAGIIAQMIKDREIDRFGSFAPEQIIPEKPFFKHLRDYDMKVFENGDIIN